MPATSFLYGCNGKFALGVVLRGLGFFERGGEGKKCRRGEVSVFPDILQAGQETLCTAVRASVPCASGTE